MIEMIKALLKSGVKTSEFWISVLALILPYFADIGSDKVTAWTTGHGWVGGLVAAVYVAARAYIKGETAKAIAAPSTGPVPGSIDDPLIDTSERITRRVVTP